MKLAADQLPNDTKLLKELVIESFNEIAVLKEQVQSLRALIFGRKSEKSKSENGTEQFLMDFGEDSDITVAVEDAVTTPETIEIPAHARVKKGRKPLAEHLPREERVIDIPDADKVCECGCMKTVIGCEKSEQLEYIPAKHKVIVNVRPKYACRKCEGTESNGSTVMIAPMPEQIIPKSFATASLLAYILASKFVDALPFYRLSTIFARSGVELSRGTMCNWAIRVASLLKPLIELFEAELLGSTYINADETPFQVLKEVGRKAEQKSYMWVFRTGCSERPTILFSYASSRSSKIPETILSSYKGYIQTDGYAGYNYIAEKTDQKHLACWAHARRKFHAAIVAAGQNATPGVAHKAFDIIKELYKIEKSAKDQNKTPEEIHVLRQEKAVPIIKDFKTSLQRWKSAVLPKSLTGQAIQYTLNLWEKLTVYLEDGRLQMDNNLAENAIRPFAVGRKNWMFSDTPQGATASATIYSILETAKANDLEPFWYMYALLEKLPEMKNKEDFIPWMPQNIDKHLVETLKSKHIKP